MALPQDQSRALVSSLRVLKFLPSTVGTNELRTASRTTITTLNGRDQRQRAGHSGKDKGLSLSLSLYLLI